MTAEVLPSSAEDPGEPQMKYITWTWRLPSMACIGMLALGCGPSDGVQTVGDGSYTASGRGYHDEASTAALERAEKHCQQTGQQVLVDDIQSREVDPGFYRTTLNFRCVDETHPDLHRPD
jgi:hypothetical protein